MKNFIVYKTSTGQILRTGNVADNMISIQAESGETVIEGKANDITQKINLTTEEVEDKSALPCSIDKTTMSADGIDLVTVSGIPAETIVIIKGEGVWQVDDGSFEFTTDTAGEYIITIRHPLYLETEYTVNAS